jgi:hypothetical protein
MQSGYIEDYFQNKKKTEHGAKGRRLVGADDEFGQEFVG